MTFIETKLKGAYVIQLKKIEDNRGFFARSWCKNEFEERGLDSNLVQCNISYNETKGTIRGMHYQLPPHQETKLVRCIRGSIFDVIIDLRKNSETFKQWFGIVLNQDNYKMLYVPKGFAHGYQTLEDKTEVFYQVSEYYNPESERGVRWDDPMFKINWYSSFNNILSKKDNSYKNYEADNVRGGYN